MALTNKLSNIATAIREKTGSTELMTLDEMPTAIAAISGGGSGGECTKHHIPDEALVISGDCRYMFYKNRLNWLIEELGDEITTKDITNMDCMFSGCTNITEIPFDIIGKGNGLTTAHMFDGCTNLRKAPYVKGVFVNIGSMFSECNKLSYIPDDFGDYFNVVNKNNSWNNCSQVFSNCNSLKSIPRSLISKLYGEQTSSSYVPYYQEFFYCIALSEISGLPIQQSALKSNTFSNTFYSCARVKDVAFLTQEDGTPNIAKWKSQTIDLSQYFGWASRDVDITGHSAYHGITTATQVTDDASYQALKDNTNYWTTDIAYSRYNHDSAVNTINSLPDTSAYLATAGGTNTIKFKGAAGSATDGGAINTLTPEEISIAAAKGWTVSLV